MNDCLQSATLLHQYVLERHWSGDALIGPDPGIRWNTRVGRFVKSYTRVLPWRDNLAYMQAQSYWILNNWLLVDLLERDSYRDIAVSCSEYVLAQQQPSGYWNYPNPEWDGRIATVEGCFAALSLVESYQRTGDESFLLVAQRWYDYMIQDVGFLEFQGTLCVNYFANRPGGLVPNNTTMVLWLLARLADATQDNQYLDKCEPLVGFLQKVQLDSGELPYAVSANEGKGRTHFLCFQYNAFEFMDLVHYYRLTEDANVLPVLERLAGYLSGGLTNDGAGRYDCRSATPEVNYYTLAIAQSLSQATSFGFGDHRSKVDRAYQRVLSSQRRDGGFSFHSRRNYHLLTDRRSYPRYLSMILHHLLSEASSDNLAPTDLLAASL